MAKRPVWQDATYDKQVSYYKKLLADFNAQETLKRNDVGTYYGTLGTPDKVSYGTYTSRYEKRGGKWVKRKKPVQKELDKYVHSKYKSNYWKDSKGKWHKRKKPIMKTGGVKKDKFGKPIQRPGKVTKQGLDPTEGLYQRELREQRTKDTSDISSDYAARGLIHSGLYAKKRGDYETEFGKQLAEINRQRSKQYSDISSERTAFQREQELQRENARLEAIRRRAAKTGDILI